MKNFLFLASIFFTGFVACSQPPVSPHDTVTSKNVKVTYGRPYKKGREIWGKLVPYGQVYRLGADEATNITFMKDGMFGGKPVKAGTYTLFATPTEKSWTLILNGQLGQWGAYDYEKYKDKDVLKVSVDVHNLEKSVEQFTFRFDKGALIIEWDKTQVSVPVS
jgi:hypothetical protein